MTAGASHALAGASAAAGSSAVTDDVPALATAGQAGCVSAVPVEVAAWVAAGHAVLAVAGHAGQWEAGSRRVVLGELDRVDRLLAAVRGKVVTAERDAGTWALRGDRDLAGFLGAQSHQGRGAGLAAVGQAGTLAAMPAVAEALVDGPVTPRHLQEITRATAVSAALATELATSDGQAQVVQLAGRLDGASFGKALAQLSASLDPSARQRSHDEQRAERSLVWSHTPSGTLIKGRLDSVAGHKFAKVIDALCPRPALDDDRSRQQRQADALMAIVERVGTDKTAVPGSLAPVQAILTFTPDTWTALRATRETEGEATPVPGSTLAVMDRLRGVDPVIDESGQPWPASEVARALCDCALTWAVLGTPGAKLDLGRESRLFKRQHWLALYAAGTRTCAVGGCGMPLAYTELHHIAWWVRGHGPTNPANCAAYCSFHHHQIHRLAIAVIRRADGALEHHYPDGRPYGPPPGDEDPGRSLPRDEAVACEDVDGPGRADRGAMLAGPRGDAAGGEDPPPDLLTLLSACRTRRSTPQSRGSARVTDGRCGRWWGSTRATDGRCVQHLGSAGRLAHVALRLTGAAGARALDRSTVSRSWPHGAARTLAVWQTPRVRNGARACSSSCRGCPGRARRPWRVRSRHV